jgi:hypothetical protein
MSGMRTQQIASPVKVPRICWSTGSHLGEYGDDSRLGGVVFSVLDTGHKGRGFKPSRGDEFLRATKIRSTPSFGWEVKPEVPCRKILRRVKDPLRYFRH